METDTIAAIATGLSAAGISIIRISGENAIACADKIFRSKNDAFCLEKAESHTIHYGYIEDCGEVIDEVLVSVMRAPNSYTKEDVAEINCHGGITVTKKILDLVCHAGARPAEPGEFTKRAFLNGRLDLSQAEAVIDIIHSKSEMALKNSVRQLRGSIREKIGKLRKKILHSTAFIEAALDDPEHISLDGFSEVLRKETEQELLQLRKLIESCENGRMLREGIKTVIIGKPNVGKSSLLNLLLGEERAIVTDIAGTTRDTLEETVFFNGITLNIVDTAGIRWTDDVVERIGVEKARRAAEDADLILYVVDSSAELDENDEEILQLLGEKNAFILLNKSDLPTVVEKKDLRGHTEHEIIRISAKNRKGLDKLERRITEQFFSGNLSCGEELYITSRRQKTALEEAEKSLIQVRESIENGMPEDFYSIDLMNAYTELGKIVGEAVDEDLINKIFQDFCMGK
ncbi:MAG: tRNA uridine-5-carboxymethylaminomethyl(34) synthesis GTPase MnmE [Lachnospiraceae bacterium]|nr:tRNA uridine-5-carboxymethylaminomethyl(34) synthesis GTPase MnmE [Lachnospiraceae bacterium]